MGAIIERDQPLGEIPDIPTASGVGAILQAAKTITGHIDRLHGAIDEIRAHATKLVETRGDDPAAEERRRTGHQLRLILDRWGL